MSNGYEILNNAEMRRIFLEDLSEIIKASNFHIIASVIMKKELIKRAGAMTLPRNPYELGMLFCIECLLKWLVEQGEKEQTAHIIFESRGKVEDGELALRTDTKLEQMRGEMKAGFSRLETSVTWLQRLFMGTIVGLMLNSTIIYLHH